MKKKALLFLLILTLSIYASNINVQITAKDNNYLPTSLELIPHDSISITSDSDLEVFPGIGTVEDPYLIDGYNITTTNDCGIRISGTTKYFIVRNCYIEDIWYGIVIFNVADGTATVINNTCENNSYGIMLEYSVSSTVANNTCNNNYIGIWFRDSVSSTVVNNTCNNNGRGISLVSSGDSTVTNNAFTNCGLSIGESTVYAYLSYTLENNCVNGKKLGFYTNLDSTTIAEPVYGQLILVNCTNVTVRDQILNSSTTGLILYFCKYLVITNNTCSNNNNYGIKLWFSSGSTLTNNTSNNNGYRGIYLFHSGSCTFTYNLLQENEEHGIFLGYDSHNNRIHNNNFIDNNLEGTSQAYDDGNNHWHDSATQEGNYWSDWSGTGNYSIDGSASSVDLYPLDEPVEYTSIVSTTDENQLSFIFTILMLVIPLILTRIISKKTKK